jgi:aryl-alcohol dehydrogenase-like predicted oxidoreductase
MQLNLNMLDTRAVESGLTELAKEYEVGLIARTPLCFGFLSGAINMDTKFPEGDHRNGWPREQVECWINGAETLLNAVTGAGKRYQTALQFCLAVPGVATVLPGMLTPEEVDQNADVDNCPSLSRAD